MKKPINQKEGNCIFLFVYGGKICIFPGVVKGKLANICERVMKKKKKEKQTSGGGGGGGGEQLIM